MKLMDKKFSELSLEELYSVLRLRNEIFVVEQNCAYQDVDGYDPFARHILLNKEKGLIGYARILAPGSKYPQCSIGRVAVAAAHRGQGLARKIIDYSIALAQKIYPDHPLIVQAQSYLEKFYQTFGFEAYTPAYDEDGVMHVDMQMRAA